jgi:hypothetical protein
VLMLHQDMHWEVEVQLHAFLILALDGSELHAPAAEKIPDIH